MCADGVCGGGKEDQSRKQIKTGKIRETKKLTPSITLLDQPPEPQRRPSPFLPLLARVRCHHGALPKVLPNRFQDAAAGVSGVVGPQDRLDGLGGLLGMVVRDLAEEVVQDVGVRDVVVGPVEEPAIVAVDRGEGACVVFPRGEETEKNARSGEPFFRSFIFSTARRPRRWKKNPNKKKTLSLSHTPRSQSHDSV